MGKFLVGLILGVAIAIGVVYYLNNSQTQLVNKFGNDQQGNTTNSNPVVLLPGTKIKELGNPNNSNVNQDESDYDFYQILQSKKISQSLAPNDMNKHQPNMVYIVQAGSFSDLSAANDMKVRLALQGYEAEIKNISKDSGVVIRVILGPYDSETEAKNIQQELAQSKIKSTIVKIN